MKIPPDVFMKTQIILKFVLQNLAWYVSKAKWDFSEKITAELKFVKEFCRVQPINLHVFDSLEIVLQTNFYFTW